MAVSGTTTHQDFTGDATGGVDHFHFTFEVTDAAWVKVSVDGVVQNSGVTVALNETPPGGTVTFAVAPADGSDIVVYREIPLTQPMSLPPYSPFPAKSLEYALDVRTMVDQQLEADRIADVDAEEARARAAEAALALTISLGAAGGNSTLITAAGSGFARTLEDRFSDFANVKDFGAVGNGVIDDTDAIQAAIDSAPRGTVFFPRGTYNHTGLSITDSTTLLGSGWEFETGTILQQTSLTTPAISIVNPSMAGCQIRNLLLRDDQASSSADAIFIHSEGNSVFDHVYIHGAGGHGVRIVGHTSCLTIRNCFIQGCKLSGIYGRGESAAQINAINILHSQISTNVQHGVNLWITVQLNIKDCTIQGNSGAGIYLNADDMATGNASCTTVNIVGNYMEQNKGGAIVGLVTYNPVGPVIHYATRVHIYENYMQLSAAVANVGVTAVMSLTGYPGGFMGLVIGRNSFNTDSLAFIDFGTAHDYRTVFHDIRLNAEAFEDVYIGASALSVSLVSYSDPSSGIADPLTGAGFPSGDAAFLGQRYFDTTNSVWYLAVRTGGTAKDWDAATTRWGRVPVTYSATMAPAVGLGSEFVITPTDGSAFAIANTTGALMEGHRITVRVINSTGGALGVLTWDPAYKLSAWTQPANGYSRAIDFQYDGTNWVEVSRTPADVPN